jgi:hypothetical protein
LVFLRGVWEGVLHGAWNLHSKRMGRLLFVFCPLPVRGRRLERMWTHERECLLLSLLLLVCLGGGFGAVLVVRCRDISCMVDHGLVWVVNRRHIPVHASPVHLLAIENCADSTMLDNCFQGTRCTEG